MKISVFSRFTLLALLSILALALVMGFVLSSLLTRAVLDWEWENTAAYAQREAELAGVDALFTAPQGSTVWRRWSEEASRRFAAMPEVVRIIVWSRDTTIIWSDKAELIGQQFPQNREFQVALAGTVAVEIRTVTGPGQMPERGDFKTLAEVYVPIFSKRTGEVLGVLGVYKTPNRLLAAIEWGRIVIWMISLAGGLALYLVLVPLVRQVYRREVQEETLRAHAGRLEQEVAGRTQELQGLLGELKTHQGRLEALLELSRRLSLIQPLGWLLGTITEACAHLLDSHSVDISLVEGDELVVMGTWGDAMPTLRVKIGESLSGIVAATGEPLLVTGPVDDPRLIPAHREAYRQLGVRAFLGVPVNMIGQRVAGVLSIRTKREQGFSAEDLSIARALASQAAVALENTRLYQETRHAYEELSRTQDQLTQAQKMEAVGRLAGGVAHDFNNLLTVIMGHSELLLRRLKPDDALRQHITLILQTADRAAALIQQLLAFSRKQVLQPKVLDLNELVAGMAKMLRRLIGEDIELRTVLSPGLGQVKADPGQLEQVILNLAVNARDAMPRGGRLLVETANAELDGAFAREHPGAHAGRYVVLAVSDTGVGMDAETRAHIFEPFFTTKGPGKGTGLGLATVYGVVKQSGGYIWVDSEPGQGATFKIYLPRVQEAVELVEPNPVPAELPQGSETILLVEDDDAVRDLAREILKTHGYAVFEARHADEALQVAAQHAGAIHLMLTDVVMPGMSGRALADHLAPQRPDMKVLYMSGYTDEAIVHHGVMDPGTAFLQKPFTSETLARKVREVLDAPASGESQTLEYAVQK